MAGCPACCTPKHIVPDVVIPCYERDLCKLKYTAKSLALHDPHQALGDVYLMWVSARPSTDYASQLDEIKGLLSAAHKQLHVIDFSAQFSAQLGMSPGFNGWFGQEVAKLKIAHSITSDFYVVMDAKNTLIRDVEKDSFQTACNQGKIYGQYRYDRIPVPHSRWYANAARFLQVDIPAGVHWPASITPMVLHRPTVLKLLQYIGEGSLATHFCDGPLCSWLEPAGKRASEFTLYNVFVYTKTDMKCNHFIEEPRPGHSWSRALWRGDSHAANLATCRRVAEGSEGTLMFGAQSEALSGLPADAWTQAATYMVKIYQGAKLFDPATDATGELVQCVV